MFFLNRTRWVLSTFTPPAPVPVRFVVDLVLMFADEPLKKPVPLHEQTVKDEKGRYQRFHGAFTGGFSAGYFNTVGSKEGGCPHLTPSASFMAGLLIFLMHPFRLGAVYVCVVTATESREASCQAGGLHG